MSLYGADYLNGFFSSLGFSGIATTIAGVIVTAIIHGFLAGVIRDNVAADPANPTEEDIRKANYYTSAVIGVPAVIYGGMVMSDKIPPGDVRDFFGCFAGGAILYQAGVLGDVLAEKVGVYFG
ncbi:hypothetical protein DRN77_06540 [Methanosarcinales archaeon]|nr:MAG: hypothetical protein DRN77_06540 [Methanosarcinales archaeon]